MHIHRAPGQTHDINFGEVQAFDWQAGLHQASSADLSTWYQQPTMTYAGGACIDGNLNNTGAYPSMCHSLGPNDGSPIFLRIDYGANVAIDTVLVRHETCNSSRVRGRFDSVLTIRTHDAPAWGGRVAERTKSRRLPPLTFHFT